MRRTRYEDMVFPVNAGLFFLYLPEKEPVQRKNVLFGETGTVLECT